MRKIIFTLILLFTAILTSFAQIEDEEVTPFEYYPDLETNIHSFFSLHYGLTNYIIKPHTSSFNNNGTIDLRYTFCIENIDEVKNATYALMSKTYYSKSDNSFGGTSDYAKIKGNDTKFGANVNISIGHSYKNLSLYPYFSLPFSFCWNKINISKYPENIPNNEKEFIDNFEGKLRYGNLREFGLMLIIKKRYMIDFSYQNQIVYPRHLVISDLGSQSIELCASVLLFIPIVFLETFNTDNTALIITNFILQSALNYGYTKLRQDKIYWPFSSGPGLCLEQFKLGFGIGFNFKYSQTP